MFIATCVAGNHRNPQALNSAQLQLLPTRDSNPLQRSKVQSKYLVYTPEACIATSDLEVAIVYDCPVSLKLEGLIFVLTAFSNLDYTQAITLVSFMMRTWEF